MVKTILLAMAALSLISLTACIEACPILNDLMNNAG